MIRMKLPQVILSVQLLLVYGECESILKDTVDIYSNTYLDNYGRNQLLSFYKSKCDWSDKIQYGNCVRLAAKVWDLGQQIKETDKVLNVCCFFWDVLECAKKQTCKPMWEPMFAFYLEHQLKDQCGRYPREAPQFSHCETQRKKPNEIAYARISKDEEPILYNLRKEIHHIFRKAMNK